MMPQAHSMPVPRLGQLWPWMLASVLILTIAIMLRNLMLGI
jgi:hypothetical protein